MLDIVVRTPKHICCDRNGVRCTQAVPLGSGNVAGRTIVDGRDHGLRHVAHDVGL